MSLAHVVYRITTDNEFAEKMQSNPEEALAEKGLWLSKEELAFLLTVLKRETRDLVRLEEIVGKNGAPWLS